MASMIFVMSYTCSQSWPLCHHLSLKRRKVADHDDGNPSHPSTSMSLRSNRCLPKPLRPPDAMTSTHSKVLSNKQTISIAVHYSLAAMMNGFCLSGSDSASTTDRHLNTCSTFLKCKA